MDDAEKKLLEEMFPPPKQKREHAIVRSPPAAPRTAQTILSAIMKKWNEELNGKNIVQPELLTRMEKLLLSTDHNYKNFRAWWLYLTDYAIRKGVIK